MNPNTTTAEQITFYSYWLPTLGPGEYSVSVTPTLAGAGSKQFDAEPVTEQFHIGGLRCALTGSETYACYPAPGQIGLFDSTLPHIVFDRCTLPWERTIDGTDPTVEHDPWLALILLTDADFSSAPVNSRRVPPILPRTLAAVVRPEAGVIGPKLPLDPYDAETDPCQTIDLPATVFRAILPRKADLPYLAHVREVETGNKETWSLLKEGKFSVVVCNRFPETQVTAANGATDWGIVNTVCLVSLEGWGDYLQNLGTSDDAGKSYRLLVLGSWRFICQGHSDFKSQMQRLDDARLLSRSLDGNKAPDGDDGFTYVYEALQMGFAPLNHDLRNDDTTISWYRGPLTPTSYEMSMSYTDISCADAALRYNSDTGMFDASYAAAWQLGRLLALQDLAFAQALCRFRTDYQRWVRSANTEALQKIAAASQEKLAKIAHLQKKLSKRSNLRDNLYVPELEEARYVQAADRATSTLAIVDHPPIPATVQNWLGQSMLLYGVPFHYLVPDEEMLPAESMRFFYLNPEWLNCLLQGACSIGRASRTDELADQSLQASFFEVSEKLAFELRSRAKQAADRRRGGTDTTDPASPPPTAQPDAQPEAVLHWPLSGYLLRSSSVEAWIGLEVKAIGRDSNGGLLKPLQILRMDRLAPDILLCIYNGQVTEIEITQPPEAIHFGAVSREGRYEKIGLRKIKGDAQTRGDRWEGPHPIDVPTYGQRVVNVSELAANIQTPLVDAHQMESADVFTSAEFALEMIEAPAKVTFRAEWATS